MKYMVLLYAALLWLCNQFLMDLCHSFNHNPQDEFHGAYLRNNLSGGFALHGASDACPLDQFHNIDNNPFIFGMKTPLGRKCVAFNISYCISLNMCIMI